MGGSPFDPILSVTHGLEMNLLSLRLLPLNRIFRFKLILFPSLVIERKSRYLSIHIRINKCGSRDRSIAPHQQLEEEKGMMSRPGLGTYQPTIPSLPLRDLEVERGFDREGR